ncbi:MAG: ribonuclease H [Gammaproteobacteria bacterium]|nr:ribonuclease H [Gammaproteobacteria bacterium]
MSTLLLFTDGSVHIQSKVGYGAFLALNDDENRPLGISEVSKLAERVQTKRFEDTSSTRLELQTLLWAVDALSPIKQKIIIHTDSQNIIGLPGRRDRLQRQDYYTKRHQRLKNHGLYRRFYDVMDSLDITLVKLEGHKPAAAHTERDRLFALVDKASREAMRG